MKIFQACRLKVHIYIKVMYLDVRRLHFFVITIIFISQNVNQRYYLTQYKAKFMM